METSEGQGEPSAVGGVASQPTARIHRIGPEIPPVQRADALPLHAGTGDSSQRWHELFARLERILRLSLGERRATPARVRAHDAVGQLPSIATEVAAALSELHTAMVHESARGRRLEVQLDAACTALARAHHELLAAQAVEKQARHLALHDGLTSLPNRSFFRAQLQRGLAPAATQPQPRTLALLYLDLDGFKAINDTHGHAVGDELLRIVAMRLRRTVRAGDMVSRVGGDEFACLPADPLDRQEQTELAFKLFNTVSAPMKIRTHEFRVRPSIGVSVFPADGTTVDALICSADAAMYRAKRLRTRVEFFGRHPGV